MIMDAMRMTDTAIGETICGIDEAGRGPVIGPLIIGCAVIDEKGKKELRELNVRDSKKIAPSRRKSLEPQVKEIATEWKLIKIQPHEIDMLRKRVSLNVIEAMKIAEVIMSLEDMPGTILVDSADTIPQAYTNKIIHYMNHYGNSKGDDPANPINEHNPVNPINGSNPANQVNEHNPANPRDWSIETRLNIPGTTQGIVPKIISEHGADDRYIEVGAASIIAKVERDRDIEKIKEEYGIEFGSGYPSDERTRKYIRNLTWEDELPDFIRKSWGTVNKAKQMKLGEF